MCWRTFQINNTAIQTIKQLYNQALSRIKIGNNVSETLNVMWMWIKAFAKDVVYPQIFSNCILMKLLRNGGDPAVEWE